MIAVQSLRAFAEDRPEQRHLLIEGSSTNFIDIAGAEMPIRQAQQTGGGLSLAKTKDGVYRVLKRGGDMKQPGADDTFRSKADAIHAIFQRLDRERCAVCDQRIFTECTGVAYRGESPAGSRCRSDSKEADLEVSRVQPWMQHAQGWADAEAP